MQCAATDRANQRTRLQPALRHAGRSERVVATSRRPWLVVRRWSYGAVRAAALTSRCPPELLLSCRSLVAAMQGVASVQRVQLKSLRPAALRLRSRAGARAALRPQRAARRLTVASADNAESSALPAAVAIAAPVVRDAARPHARFLAAPPRCRAALPRGSVAAARHEKPASAWRCCCCAQQRPGSMPRARGAQQVVRDARASAASLVSGHAALWRL